MSAETLLYCLAGRFRRLHLRHFGDPALPVLLCLHGLTRNGQDFEELAAALADRFHVVCPDMPGRGGSEWLAGPGEYQLSSYLACLTHLIAATGSPVDIVGTSMGGICGMALAAMPDTPVRRLVLNDIGSHVPAAALAAIATYVQASLPVFATPVEAEAWLRRVHAPFGTLTDGQWHRLAHGSTRALPQGGLTLHYDPAIAEAFNAAPPTDLNLGGFWSGVACPVLVLRGEHSSLLSATTLERMASKAATHVVAGCGHAPALMDAPTIAVIREFLTA